MLPQLLSLLLPLIAANEIMMMQRQLMGAQPAQGWGRGRREGGSRLAAPSPRVPEPLLAQPSPPVPWRGHRGPDTSLSITALHSFATLRTHKGSLDWVLPGLGLLYLCIHLGQRGVTEGGRHREGRCLCYQRPR